ncbi:hypothetical protein [Streptomyces sp. NPDC058045]|uniref:hypothetical protein n=1 Tax=Streptomyces sp. NPDC058045 TaxID=3346311 RepID=UPI0036E2232B
MSITKEGESVLSDVRAAKQGWLVEAIDHRLDPAQRRTLTEAVTLVERLVAE